MKDVTLTIKLQLPDNFDCAEFVEFLVSPSGNLALEELCSDHEDYVPVTVLRVEARVAP